MGTDLGLDYGKFLMFDDVWNKAPDEFNEHCTRWVKVKDLEEGMEIAVPVLEEKKLPFISSIVMAESEKNNNLPVIINFKLQDKTLENVNSSFSSKIMPQRLVTGWIENNLTNLLFENFSQERILFASLVNLSLALGMDNTGITHSVNISSTEFNLIKCPFFLCSSSLTNSFFNGSQSTGCQSILSQNFQSSSDISLVLRYLSNISFFKASSLANSDQLTQEKCFISSLNLSKTDNVIDTIYISPLLTNSSNFLNCLSFTANRSLIYSAQFISGCLSNLFFNSSGIDTVKVAIFVPPQYFVNTLEFVDIYKSFGFGDFDFCMDDNLFRSRLLEEKVSIMGTDLGLDFGNRFDDFGLDFCGFFDFKSHFGVVLMKEAAYEV